MTKLTKTARGKPCKIMLPGYAHDPDTTVLCHLRMAGITGGGQRSPDILAAWGCFDCHRVTEGEQLSAEERQLDRDWLRLMFLEGVMRTQYELIRKGVIK